MPFTSQGRESIYYTITSIMQFYTQFTTRLGVRYLEAATRLARVLLIAGRDHGRDAAHQPRRVQNAPARLAVHLDTTLISVMFYQGVWQRNLLHNYAVYYTDHGRDTGHEPRCVQDAPARLAVHLYTYGKAVTSKVSTGVSNSLYQARPRTVAIFKYGCWP